MTYPILLIVHLLAAAAFFGTLFFEVVILSGLRRRLPSGSQAVIDQALSRRAREVLHWVVVLLYGAGIGLAWQHREQLSQPFSSVFSGLLTLKIILALSVVGHYLLLAWLLGSGRMTPARSRRVHLAIFAQLVLIALLAKGMFYL
ncbi:MAG: CopD family copper resistance protein [Pseudomonas sp.]